MQGMITKIWNWVTGILTGLIVLLAIVLLGVRLMGFEVFTVLSGSMEPTYSAGDLLYTKDVEYTTLEAGDVVTYLVDENTVVTHRILEVVPDEEEPSVLRYRTKGDANADADAGLLHYKNIIGTPSFSIPLLGYVANYISQPPGMYVGIGICAAVILMAFLPDLFKKEDPEEKSREGKYVGRYERTTKP